MAAQEKREIEAARKAFAALQLKLVQNDGGTSCAVFLCAGGRGSKADRWKRMKFDANLSSHFRKDVLAHLKKQLDLKEEVEPFTFDDMVSGHVGFWKKSESADLQQWFAEVPEPNWPHIFSGDAAFLSKVKFHATVIPLDGTKSMVVFRHRGSGSLLHKGGVMALFDTTEHQFKELSDKVFHFDHGADFVEWDGWIFILDHRRFESLTNIRDITISKASAALSAIDQSNNIAVDEKDKLNAVIVAKPLLARKIAAAAQIDIFAQLTGKAMVERIVTKRLPIKHKKVGKTYHFLVDPNDADQVREFVYLITDYYLSSPLTKREYRVPSKYPA